MSPGSFHLRLPASSANLGPGFDTAALALALYLDVIAEPAATTVVSATGRDAELCSRTEGNLLLDTYREILIAQGGEPTELKLTVQNEIPLGMGCGSSAAARLMGIALANHFGELQWGRAKILDEAARREGHPDNASACWLGGFAVAAIREEGSVLANAVAPPDNWNAILVLPADPLATEVARKVVPAQFPRVDVVYNLQRVALLTAGFASGEAKLVREAMQDRLHQPYRASLCPLLPALEPLRNLPEILGVSLSGAGPSVLILHVGLSLDGASEIENVSRLIRNELGRKNLWSEKVEILPCALAPLGSDLQGACSSLVKTRPSTAHS